MSAPNPAPGFAGPTQGGVPTPTAPIDPQALARLATAFFSALPGQSPRLASTAPAPAGVQAPINPAAPGSPLVSPAGLGPSVPGTPIPQGQIPGANLLPTSPTPLAPLAYRAPALLPHAEAGNGVPDGLLSNLPGYEPRIAAGLSGVPQAGGAATPETGGDTGYYFLDSLRPSLPRDAAASSSSTPASSTSASPAASAASVLGSTRIDDRLADLALTEPLPSLRLTQPEAPPLGAPLSEPSFYFIDAVAPPEAPAVTSTSRPRRGDEERHPPFDVHTVRRDFPILSEKINGRQLVWFDNGATTHKPQAVIDRLAHFYAHENSNIHRAAHELAARATDAYEGARESARRFINAPEVEEVIFVRGTTEAINLVAQSFGRQHVGEGDEILVSHLEHHANIVPWQQLAAAKGAILRVIPVDDRGQILLDEYTRLLNDRTKIVAVTQVSNALGTVTPVERITELAHRAGAKVLIDGAQSVSHLRVDVQALDADFFVFSGHKIFGPTGIGVLWGKRALLEEMPPWQGGGNMIADVTFERTFYQPIPNKFEAGTGNIADAVGLGAALDYVTRIGIENIGRFEHELLTYATGQLQGIEGVRLIGTAADKASVLSFTLAGYTTDEVGQALNQEGIAVRTGHHCAQPILRRFGVESTVRASLAFYNTFEEIDRLIEVVKRLAS